MSKLRLIAHSAEDIPVVSAAVQDAILKVGDIRFDKKRRFLSIRLSRFRHESPEATRIETGLRIDGVLDVKSKGIDRSDADGLAVLLGVKFNKANPPGGDIEITFAGGGVMLLSVEAVDIMLADVGEPRTTKSIPNHEG